MNGLSNLYSNTGDCLANLLGSTNDSYSKTVGKVGNVLEHTKKDLFAASAAPEDSPELRKLAVQYGLLTEADLKISKGSENYKPVSREGMVMAIKDSHESASRVLAMISSMMDEANRAIRGIIEKIGR